MSSKFYAVARGFKVGVFENWQTAGNQVRGYPGAEYKAFATEAEARAFLAGSKKRVREDEECNLPRKQQKPSSTPFQPVYVDGACSNNARHSSSSRAGIGVYFGPNDARNVSENLPGSVQTNQRAELGAAIRAMEIAGDAAPTCIYSDSMYLVRGVGEWMPKWKTNGWRSSQQKTVSNMDQWKRIDALVSAKPKSWYKFVHVRGHSNVAGNIEADKLAVAGAERVRK